MKNRQSHAQCFLCFEKMPNISAGIVLASRAGAVGVDRRGVKRKALVEQVDLTLPGKQVAVTRVSGRHDAVKKIDAPIHALQYIDRRADPHQIARLVLRHERLYRLDNSVHFLGAFPNS